MNEQSLQNVRVSAEVHAAHPAGLVEMCEGPLSSGSPDSSRRCRVAQSCAAAAFASSVVASMPRSCP
jgi:hypothetical protein